MRTLPVCLHTNLLFNIKSKFSSKQHTNMDCYEFYLSTLRYVMNAKVEEKSTWSDIFKYLPCLRQMLSCCVCGQLIKCPHGPPHSVCFHNICSCCVGGIMNVRPSCSWCKDQANFKENRKLQILISCFKRLCAYISTSVLGAEILKESINGCGIEVERTLNILKEVEQFQDDFQITPPLKEFPMVSKSASKCSKLSKNIFRLSTKFGPQDIVIFKRKRGRPKSSTLPDDKKKALSEQIKKIKKKAFNPKAQNFTTLTYLKPYSVTDTMKRRKREVPSDASLLIAQRPHRDRSGKYSIGQLWRETFIEETHHEPEPDSGIEVGSASDQDHTSNLATSVIKNVAETFDNVSKPCDLQVQHKDTRLQKKNEGDRKVLHSNNEAINSKSETAKPRLTLTISKKKYQTLPRQKRKLMDLSTEAKEYSTRVAKVSHHSSSEPMTPSKKFNLKSSARQRTDICKCARFKMPTQLTCFGQKCPCYSDKRGCNDCLCNGCKNPLKVLDAAPPLMHVIRDIDSLDHSFDRSMPRLSPIPKI